MKKRMSIVDFWKFAAAMLIMAHHVYHLGEPFRQYEYKTWFCWIFTEFFFILTGYFTCRHFLAKKDSGSDIFKTGLMYEVRKFKPLLPYTTVAITLEYFLSSPYKYILNGKPDMYIKSFLTYPFEVLMLGEVFNVDERLLPMWFLSAMILVFPIITAVCQLKSKYLILLLSGAFPIFYFLRAQISISFPDSLLRALAGMLLGVFVCVLTDVIREERPVKDGKMTKIVFSLVEFSCMIICVVVSVFNYYAFTQVVIFLFAVAIGVMMSGHSITAEFNNGFVSYLGNLSMPIFIWNWLVASALYKLRNYLPGYARVLLFYAITLAVSAASYSLINSIKKKIQIKKQKA